MKREGSRDRLGGNWVFSQRACYLQLVTAITKSKKKKEGKRNWIIAIVTT